MSSYKTLPTVFVDRRDYLERIATAKKHLKEAHRALSSFDARGHAAAKCYSNACCAGENPTCPHLPRSITRLADKGTIKLPNNKTKYGRGAPFDDVL